MLEIIVDEIRTWFEANGEDSWFLVYCISLVLFAGIEVYAPAFQDAPKRSQRWPTNFGIGLVNIGLTMITPVTAVVAARWAEANGYGLLNIAGTTWWVAVIVTVVIRSFAGYGFHFLMHKIQLFWRVHRVHHSDTHLDISTGLRSHPLEFLAMLFVLAPLAVVVGFNSWALIIFEITDSILNLVSHANLRLPERADRVLRWVFITPNMHCLHHSSYRPETDSNYGQVFSVWDRLFGTYSAAPRAGYDAMQFGLVEIRDERASDIVWQIKSPLLRNIEPQARDVG
jgi:sterol desaturase/sphingolipid hydroxylase (fatty acid hydroxylase superfamily)